MVSARIGGPVRSAPGHGSLDYESSLETVPGPPCSSDRKERILEALGDRWAREILLLLSDGPRSAQEIQASNRMPQSTLYRKLHELSEIGLIGIQRSVISPDGKRVELYRSLLEELTVEMRGTRLTIDVRFRDLSSERLKELWQSVRQQAGRP
jgi:DNA-binding HxlR family transcriptional regulator